MDKLEEIRKRDEEWDYSSRLDACDDRRLLLREVDAQQEELGRLRKVLMEFRNEFYNLQLMAKALGGIEVKPSAFEKLVIQIDDVLARRVLKRMEE